MHAGTVELDADTAADQEFRAAAADRIATAAARGRLARRRLGQLRKTEDVAPDLPGRGDLLGVRTAAEWNGERGIAVDQHQHLRIVDAAHGNAEEIADANVDRHPHALDGTAQHDAFAMKFDLPRAAIRARILRVEGEREGKWVEPQCAARPGGIDSACWWLTPQDFISPPGLCSRSMRETLAGRSPFRLRKPG